MTLTTPFRAIIISRPRLRQLAYTPLARSGVLWGGHSSKEHAKDTTERLRAGRLGSRLL
jgi:hypothetical protein